MSHPDRISNRRGVFRSALDPLHRRIPLMMAGVLALIVGAMLWLGYRRVHHSVIGAEVLRLATAAQQLTASLEPNVKRLRAENAKLARNPTLAQAVDHLATADQLAAARSALADERKRAPQSLAIALWSSDGRLIAVDGDRSAAALTPPRMMEAPASDADTADIGHLVARGDTVLFATTSPIVAAPRRTVGFVALVRRLNSNPGSAALLGGLVGRGGLVLIGNASGDLWSDFAVPVRGPGPIDAAGGGEYRDRAGVARVYSATPLANTPWVILADVPRDVAVVAAHRFIWEMLALASAILIVGTLLGWLLIVKALRPLDQVGQAAESIAAGDYATRVTVGRDDEIGRLGASFNVMADRVQQATRETQLRAEMLEDTNRRLHASEQRYRDLIEHSPNGLLVHRGRRVLFANIRATQMLGAKHPDELVGRSILDFVPNGERERVDARSATVERGAPVPPLELRVVRADKRTTIIEVSSMPFVIDGENAVQTIMHDVTEHRLLEEQLRQAQKMDAVGRLAGGIAHDFNNLLTVIQAHAEFALGEELSTEARADVVEIRRATESAARLTRQLLTFSRKRILTPTNIDLNVAIGGMLGMVERLIGADIEVVNVSGHGLREICADAGQLEQVILNLAVNARDAMPNGGVLRIETANVTLGEGYEGASGTVIPAGDYVMISVADTGIGMTDDVRRHLFEPFFTTKQPGRGTGLGLSTVYGIVKQAGGYIWVYSEPGRGSTFKLFFPPDLAPHETRAETGEFPTPASAGGRVLLVEDQATVRGAISRALSRGLLTVVEAQDAESALAILARDRNIDLVISDMVMPGKSGADLVDEIVGQRPGMPVIIMSGYSEETASRHWRVPESAAFIEKPVSPSALLDLVHRMLIGVGPAA